MLASIPGRLALVAAMASGAAVATGASAGEQRVGAWVVGSSGEGAETFAVTRDERGVLFGQFCYPELGACAWVLLAHAACEPGAELPVVVNSDAGAAVLGLVCLGVEGKAVYAFSDFDAVDALVRKARRATMAIPIPGGGLLVSRFSLRGAQRAVGLMRESADAQREAPPDASPEPAPARYSF